MGVIRPAVLMVTLVVTMSMNIVSAQDWLYSVRTHDTLWDICNSYVDKSLCWIRLGEYNELENNDLIKPGAVLRIPYAWLKAPPKPATILDSRGEVYYLPASAAARRLHQKKGPPRSLSALLAAGVNLQSLPEQGSIYMGDRIITGAGNVSVRFGDGTVLLIRPHTDIIFDRISVKDGKGYVDTLLMLKRGATNYRVQGGQKGLRFQVETPAGVAAVRGTEFRVNVQHENRALMINEVLEGAVQVFDITNPSSQQVVRAGYGVKKEQNQPVPKPRKLLPAVLWKDNLQRLQSVPFRVYWEPIPGALYYRVDLFDSNGLSDSWKTELNYWEAKALPDDRYRLQVRGVDEISLEGQDAEQAFEVFTPLPVPELTEERVRRGQNGLIELQWPAIASAVSYRVEMAEDAGFTKILVAAETEKAEYRFRQKSAGYVRVSALYPEQQVSKVSEVIKIAPQKVGWLPWAGAAVILALILF